MSARDEWLAAQRAVQAVLREPGALGAREQELLRVSVLPQLELAIAALDDGVGDIAGWHAFLPDAIASLAGPDGLDAGLADAREHVQRGLDALAGTTTR